MSSLILFLMLISLVCKLSSLVVGGVAACEVREREALLELKEAMITRWPSWGRPASDCCQWQGIKCHNVTGRVIQVKFDFWQFSSCGSNSMKLSSSIANLLHLQVLDVRNLGCVLQGTIPPHLGSLPNLVRLAIVNTDLSGPIPPALGALAKLKYLDLSQNSLNGSIPPQLGSLGRLTYLNLSRNSLEGTLFPSHLGYLQNLVYLDLSHNYNLESSVFTDSVSWKSLGNLSRLQHLDISAFDYGYALRDTGILAARVDAQYRPSWPCQWSSLRHFACSGVQFRFPAHSVPFCFDSFNHHLQYLDLSNTGLHSTAAVIASLSNASNLRYLSLAFNNFQSFPPCLFQLPLLETLDMSNSDLRSRIPAALANLTALQHLDLAYNNLTGTVEWEPSENMTSSLQIVLLGKNMLTGPIPAAFSRCTILDLSHNYFSGSLPGSVGNIAILDISYNNLSALPASLGNCTGLIYAGLGNNGFIGSIPASMGNCTQLKTLDLSHNLLTGCIPPSLGHIHNLSDVDLSSLDVYDSFPNGGIFLNNNWLSGSIPTTLGCLGQGVQQLDISNNNLTGSIPPTLGCLGQTLQQLDISNNNLSGFIPSSLGNLTRLDRLDLSWNSLTSAGFPPCFQNTSIWSLTLSHNKLSGSLPSPLLISSTIFDLQSNFFEGSLPLLSVSTGLLDFSRNSFGTIPYHFCNLSSNLVWLSLSSNHLVGGIPDSFSGSASNLQYLDFSNNGLSGSLPSSISNCTFLTILKVGNNRLGKEIQSIGSLCQAQSIIGSTNLESLQLHNNNFTGKIPPALKKCTAIRLMDLSHNWFTGRIPRWMGKGQHMVSLKILSLRNNHLEGSIPSALTNLSKLGILDLANNHLSGRIPEGLHRLQGMQNPSRESIPSFFLARYYEDEITISSKGSDMKLEPKLALYTCLDLSGNHLHGEIPPEIGTLIGLLTLNLSHNMLGGPIPSTLGNVTALESLDLSCNHFNGTIPEELVHLTFLEVLNVSNNLLHGRIPQGRQFSTFNNASSFEGNPGLCGPPLPNPCICRSPPPPPASTTDQEHLSFLEKMEEHVSLAALGIGFALGFLIVGYLFNFVIWKPNSRM